MNLELRRPSTNEIRFQALADFEYKKNGFFGRIVPVQNKINSQLLLSNIKLALSTFNQESYAS